jgi:DNA-binding NtrC family response regulator
LAVILRHAGYHATAAYSAKSALNCIRQWEPHLIISDVMMPGLNGVEMAIQVRESLPSCEVLLFSGQAATANLLKDAVTQGYSFELLTKPVHPQDMIARVRSTLVDSAASKKHETLWRGKSSQEQERPEQ